jgi:hypothetical protein
MSEFTGWFAIKKMKILIFTLIIAIAWPLPASLQQMITSEKDEVINSLILAIEKNYVERKEVDSITSLLNHFRDSNLIVQQTPQTFAIKLTEVLRNATRDAHFMVRHEPKLYQDLTSFENGPITHEKASVDELPPEKQNYYIPTLQVLQGNVGYIKLERIPSLSSSRATVDAAMSFLSNTDAIILDLRGNGGGRGGFIPYLISYFFPPDSMLLYRCEI